MTRYQTFYELRDQPERTLLSEHEVQLTIEIAEAVKAVGGLALVVGGYPRDIVMHERLGKRLETKDVDLEVYGLQLEQLQNIIAPIHHINAVGASFGVLKVSTLDVSLPRKDSKTGAGHRGFEIVADPTLSHAEAARRRDFTINTLALNPLTGELFDEHHGTQDIERQMLRMVDPDTFGDDPLRSLRAMQFVGRFGFHIDTETLQAAQGLNLRELSKERVGEEWLKLLLKSEQPSRGLAAALELGVIEQLHPELLALVDTPQEPEWHPEGSVWNHTLMAIDVVADIIRREGLGRDEAMTVMLGALCHDLGKPLTTALDSETGRIRSHEHAKAGVPLAHAFMQTLCVPIKIQQKVEHIVFDHMFLPEVRQAKDAAIRRLAKRLAPATVQELIWVTEADFCGRTLENPDLSLIRLFQKRADELAVADAPLEHL
ncbi:MAG TPA: HD domain-containing protein, partial [Candidatus Limnocylindrales bacterium]|nr:HD domain-containing protein [Candidatus Limnocylindrales bacterium]